jgi:hypothetical protein
MAKFQPIVDIWALDDDARSKLQRGQWVRAGSDDSPMARGVFCGVRPSGAYVVMWQGNAKGRKSYAAYRKALMEYGRAQA